MHSKTRIRAGSEITSSAPLARFSLDNTGTELSGFPTVPHANLSTYAPTALLHQDRSYLRERKPRGFANGLLPQFQNNPPSGFINHFAARLFSAAFASVYPAVDRNSAGTPEPLLCWAPLLRPIDTARVSPPALSRMRSISHDLKGEDLTPMFIDYVMTICDRIMRRAAEKNPRTACLQNIPVDAKDNDLKPTEETN